MQSETTTATTPDRTSPPDVHEFSGLTLPGSNHTVLSNGIRLTTLDNGAQPVYRLTLRWDGGNLDTPCQEVPQVMAAVINEGTDRHNGAEIAEILEYNGAWTRYESSAHYFGATLFGLTARPGEVLDIFTEVLSSPVFPDEAVTARRDKLAAQCRTSREKITSKVQDIFLPMTYGADAPKAHRSTDRDFMGVTPEMVRDHYRRHLKATPPRAYLAGRLTPELVAEVTRRLEAMTFEPVGNPVEIHSVAPQFNPEGDFRRLTVDDSLQSARKIAIPTIGRDNPDYETLRLASVAFGGHFGSRLMQNIREDKGYTYGISAQLATLPGEGSFLVISCQTDNGFVDGVLSEINSECGRMASEPLSDEELTGVRRLILSALAGVLDSPFSICDYMISQQELGQSTGSYLRLQETARRVTAADLARAFSNHILPNPHLTAIAGK